MKPMSDNEIFEYINAKWQRDEYDDMEHVIREALRLKGEQSQWVSVSEKLPEMGTTVLVAMKWNEDILPAFLKDDKLWKVDLHPGWHEASENDIYAGSILTDVTHWMYLPPKPQT